jgi:hypothetical protein
MKIITDRTSIAYHCRRSETRCYKNNTTEKYYRIILLTIGNPENFGHFFNSRVDFRFSVFHFMSEFIKHPDNVKASESQKIKSSEKINLHGLLVQFCVYLPRYSFQSADRIRDGIELLILGMDHSLLLLESRVQEGVVRAVHFVLQFGVLSFAMRNQWSCWATLQ